MSVMPTQINSSLDHYLYNNITVYNYGRTFQKDSIKMGVHGIFDVTLSRLQSALMHIDDYEIREFSNSYIQGFFVILKNEIHLLITCDSPNLIYKKDFFTQSLDAHLNQMVQQFAKEKSVDPFMEYDFTVFILVLDSYYSVLSYMNKISGEEIHRLKVKNSFLDLSKKFQSLSRGDYVNPQQHLDFFAWIYHVEVSAIAQLVGTNSPIILHDVATNTAFWPSVLATQKPADLNGLQFSKICCSDIDLQLMQHTHIALGDLKIKELERIEIFQLDVTEVNDLLCSADVITANDILEHFSEEESFKVFENLWKTTRRLLVIHVPFEEVPTAAYGHLSQFNRSKLQDWVARLEDCCDCTEKVRPCAKGHPDQNFIHQFLFLERISTRLN